MDPITLIVSALVSGAAAALQDTASDVIKETYQALKSRLHTIFVTRNQPTDVLDALAANEADLNTAIQRSDAAEAPDVVAMAEKLVGLLKQSDNQVYTVTAKNVGNVGSNAHIESQTFN